MKRLRGTNRPYLSPYTCKIKEMGNIRKGKLLLFSVAWVGVGISICQNAIFSSISYFSMQFGEDIFLWICFMVFAPALPVSVFQMKQNEKVNREEHLKRRTSSCVRIFLAFATNVMFLILLSYVSSKWALLGLTFAVSLVQTNTFCIAFRLVSSLPNQEMERLQASISFGYQGSTACVILAQFLAKFEPDSGDVETFWFYALNACCLIFSSIGLFHFYLATSDSDDFASNEIGSSLLGPGRHDSLSMWKQVKSRVKDPFWGLFVTIYCSIVIFPFYSFVPSSDGSLISDMRLARNLVYVKTICDSFSRPIAAMVPVRYRAKGRLLLTSLVRALFVPFFLLYLFSSSIPKNDYCLYVLIGVFSFSSG